MNYEELTNMELDKLAATKVMGFHRCLSGIAKFGNYWFMPDEGGLKTVPKEFNPTTDYNHAMMLVDRVLNEKGGEFQFVMSGEETWASFGWKAGATDVAFSPRAIVIAALKAVGHS